MTDPIHPLLKKLADRKIVVTPRDEPPPDRLALYLEAIKQEKAIAEAKIKAELEAEAEARRRAQPPAAMASQAIALNGVGVLNAAAAGIGRGATINGGISDLIRGGIQRGWNE